MMNRALPVALAASASILFGIAVAAPRVHLFQDERVCDTRDVLCFRGSLSYLGNPRVLHLRGRVLKAPGPGLLRIRVTGTNELGHHRSAPIEVRLRGNYSEIINHKMIPDYPDVEAWHVESVVFFEGE